MKLKDIVECLMLLSCCAFVIFCAFFLTGCEPREDGPEPTPTPHLQIAGAVLDPSGKFVTCHGTDGTTLLAPVVGVTPAVLTCYWRCATVDGAQHQVWKRFALQDTAGVVTLNEAVAEPDCGGL